MSPARAIRKLSQKFDLEAITEMIEGLGFDPKETRGRLEDGVAEERKQQAERDEALTRKRQKQAASSLRGSPAITPHALKDPVIEKRRRRA